MRTPEKELRTRAFTDFAEGRFEAGVQNLSESSWWHDDASALNGPFHLCFDQPGFGESLLLASLLKRRTANIESPIAVHAECQARSILRHDGAFRVLSSKDALRSPLAILREALVGDLLRDPFTPGHSVTAVLDRGKRPRVGIAWESVGKSGCPIPGKNVPLDRFQTILAGVDADFIVFQRQLGIEDRQACCRWRPGRFDFIGSSLLDDDDQSDILNQVASLDVMVTISTTTAHMAGYLGIPTVLLAARRPNGFQWFWRAQADHGKLIYPSVDIILGGEGRDDWWTCCLARAQASLRAILLADTASAL